MVRRKGGEAMKPFLFSFRWTRQDNPVQYKLVYAETEVNAKSKLCKWISKHTYGEFGAKVEAVDVHCETIL